MSPEYPKTKGYAEKYRQYGEPIHLIGVEFSRESRNIVGFEVEHICTVFRGGGII